jgi:hypothetical protein
VKTRSKFRTLIAIRSARSSTDSRVPRCSAIQICSSRIFVISDACDASDTLTCGCPARPPQEQHELARGLVGESGAAVLLDPGQREVDARGEAGRGVDLPVLDPDRVVLDVHVGIALGQLAARTSNGRSRGVP